MIAFGGVVCRLHDFDNNTKLDGLEIYKALTHLLPYEEQDDTEKVDPRGKTAEQVHMEKKKAELNYYTGRSMLTAVKLSKPNKLYNSTTQVGLF